MYETIVFDLDGTLLDTLDDLTGAVNAALTKFALPLRSREEVRGFVGNGIVKLMERAVRVPRSDFQEILSEFKRYYALHCADKTRPYKGIMPLLAELKERGKNIAVLSNKADFAVKALCKEYFDGFILEAVGENEEAGIRKKPAPDSLFAVMKNFSATKDSVVYVGDSEVDIQTAQNAGVACLSVTWGFKDKEFLLKNGATALADTPEEVLAFVERGKICK